ncbi:MAG TPA: nuclear transport factor 2 family protein [Myxococcales bacterium]|jgi:ketosteroid isomerase-like protein|nr:nuclear transport factor 2 family protein [Myxococcales bacterium]
MAKSPEEVVRAFYRAYRARERDEVGRLMAPEFRFTSPYDDAIDRETWFERCWAPGDQQQDFQIERCVASEDAVYMTYKVAVGGGKSFRNTELHRVRDGLVASVHVFFGETFSNGKFAAQTPPVK